MEARPARLPVSRSLARLVVVALAALAGGGCGGEETAQQAAQAPERAAPAPPAAPALPAAPPAPADLPRALLLALAQFDKSGGGAPMPGAARAELLVRRGGEWQVEALEDPEAIVFHKVMLWTDPDGGARLLTAAGARPGEAAGLKLWRRDAEGAWRAEAVWQEHFGGKFSRMRDVEVGDLDGDGRAAMAVATHDQGIVAVVRPDENGGFEVEKLDEKPDTFVHEIELGDLDADGALEVYATPSEPNRLDGTVQTGEVVRYEPASGEGRTVVSRLEDRHAKEILVADVDGDGADELYVVVEGHVDGATRQLSHGVEVRRYEADTPPDAGVVVAEVDDRLSRFLTAGDVDGDGKRELVLATFSKGLWLLRPGDDPMKKWEQSLIDADSGGFEHAALLTDLDGDGTDELYVASDDDKQVRRYVWVDGRPTREVIYRRDPSRDVFTWNLMPVPAELVP